MLLHRGRHDSRVPTIGHQRKMRKGYIICQNSEWQAAEIRPTAMSSCRSRTLRSQNISFMARIKLLLWFCLRGFLSLRAQEREGWDQNLKTVRISLHRYTASEVGEQSPPSSRDQPPDWNVFFFFLFTAFGLAHMNLHSSEDARDEIMLTEKLQSRINKTHLSICLWRRRLRFVGASV